MMNLKGVRPGLFDVLSLYLPEGTEEKKCV
jgi:hypothetical protein